MPPPSHGSQVHRVEPARELARLHGGCPHRQFAQATTVPGGIPSQASLQVAGDVAMRQSWHKPSCNPSDALLVALADFQQLPPRAAAHDLADLLQFPEQLQQMLAAAKHVG